MSLARQNYHEECEAAVNKQINMEFYASYLYHAMAIHFDRDDVALPGFCKFFTHAVKEEREHAEKLIKFQTDRGGRVKLHDIKEPPNDSWDSGLQAMQQALDVEKKTNQALLNIHALAVKHDDAHMADFLEDHFLKEQVEEINTLAKHVTNLTRVGPGLGEYMYDKETLQEGDD